MYCQSGNYTNPSVAQFQSQFSRDFPFGIDSTTQVLDSDITYAFCMTNVNINQGLFSDQGSYTIGYNLMSAHFLVMNLRASSQGINGQYNFLQNSKGVGSVNESFQIPDRIMSNPYWAMFTKTNYGSQFLFLILPQLCGQFFSVMGTTLP